MENKKGRLELSESKKDEISSLSSNLKNFNSVLITSIDELPALLFRKIKLTLKDKAEIKVVKRRVILKFFEDQSKKNKQFEKLADFCQNIKDSCAIIFTNEDLFAIVKELNSFKENKKAKPGPAKDEIVVAAGKTGLMPGPILTELADAGIASGLEKGKVVIKQPLVISKGGKITEALSNALAKLNIFPVTTKLLPLVGYDQASGILFKTDDLEINVEKELAKIIQAQNMAFNLTLEAKYFTKDNSVIFIRDAYKEASHICREFKVFNKDSIQSILVEANNFASQLNEKL